MPIPGVFVRETGVRELQLCTAIVWRELKSYDGFSTFGSRVSGDPRQLHQVIGNQFQKPSVMWVALSFEMRFEEIRNIHLPLHHEGARLGKPLV